MAGEIKLKKKGLMDIYIFFGEGETGQSNWA